MDTTFFQVNVTLKVQKSSCSESGKIGFGCEATSKDYFVRLSVPGDRDSWLYEIIKPSYIGILYIQDVH